MCRLKAWALTMAYSLEGPSYANTSKNADTFSNCSSKKQQTYLLYFKRTHNGNKNQFPIYDAIHQEAFEG